MRFIEADVSFLTVIINYEQMTLIFMLATGIRF